MRSSPVRTSCGSSSRRRSAPASSASPRRTASSGRRRRRRSGTRTPAAATTSSASTRSSASPPPTTTSSSTPTASRPGTPRRSCCTPPAGRSRSRLRDLPHGSGAGEPPSLAAQAAAAADPDARAPRGGGGERRRRRGPPPPRRVRVQRRAAAERGAATRRLGAPARLLVEALAPPIPLAAGVLVLFDVELGVGDRAQDLARARQLRPLDVPLGVPELRAQQCLRTLRVRLLDLDEDAEPRDLAVDRAPREELGVVDDPRAAVDAEGVIDARDEEEERDPVVLEQVRQRVRELVPRAVGQEERPLVEDADEAGRVAARRHVETRVRAARRDDDERRPLDELAGQRVEPVGDLPLDQLRRLAEQASQLRLVHAENLGARFSRTAATPSRTSGPVMSRNSSSSEASKIGPARTSHSLSASFVWEIAAREPAASRRAISSARSSSSSSGTQRDTSPIRSASAPSISSQSSR